MLVPVVLRYFADGALCAAPKLDLTIKAERGEVERILKIMCSTIERTGAFAVRSVSGYKIAFNQSTQFRKNLTPNLALDWICSELTKASQTAVRQSGTTLALAGLPYSKNENTAPADSLRMTLGSCPFPDDPAILNLSCTFGAATAWSTLEGLRDNLLLTLGPPFCSSTLGYGFVCDVNRFVSAAAQMELLCMRYLGLDLHDPFGGYSSLQARGVRSINWQVCLAGAWVNSLGASSSTNLLKGGTPHHGSLLWKASDQPSYCDRNDPADHPTIAAYAALDAQFEPLKFVPRLPWFPGWDESTIERWATRWHEISA